MEQITVFNKKSHEKIRVRVSLVVFEEDGRIIYYCPSLDLNGYGKSEPAARRSFETTLKETVRYCMEENTFRDMLDSLGWIRTPGTNTTYKAPSLASKIYSNDYLQSVISDHSEVTLKNNYELTV